MGNLIAKFQSNTVSKKVGGEREETRTDFLTLPQSRPADSIHRYTRTCLKHSPVLNHSRKSYQTEHLKNVRSSTGWGGWGNKTRQLSNPIRKLPFGIMIPYTTIEHEKRELQNKNLATIINLDLQNHEANFRD